MDFAQAVALGPTARCAFAKFALNLQDVGRQVQKAAAIKAAPPQATSSVKLTLDKVISSMAQF